MIRTLIYGVTGYTGAELIRLLSSHPQVEIVGGSSRQWAGQRAAAVFPFVHGKYDFPLHSNDELHLTVKADVAFLALPHGESAVIAGKLLDAGVKVIDLSADMRLRDAETYGKWYGAHKAPELLQRAVYGLPEVHRDKVRTAELVANPGCYPTSVILGIAPLIRVSGIDTETIVVDAKSGVSGAGRAAKLTTSFCEAGESFKPYGVLGHRHIPEMEQELSLLAGRTIKVRFTPHLVPMVRGMVSTMYVRTERSISAAELRAMYDDRYRNEPFVRVMPEGVFPDTAHVRGSNMCHVSVHMDERTGWIVAISAIDNLVKGASGEAVQNMNLMMGLAETAGLEGLPMFP